MKLSEQRVKGYRNFLTKIWNANNFLIANKCDFNVKIIPDKLSLNINKWIYSELIKTKNLAEQHVKGYRFDEASRLIYKFVWNSYCDWYLELSKTILSSKNAKNIKEVKSTAGFVFKEALILLHPFIPFITEELWLKNKLKKQKEKYLMYSNWIKDSKIRKDKEIANVDQVIDVISKIRSFKNELNVSPVFILIFLSKMSKKRKSLFKE